MIQRRFAILAAVALLVTACSGSSSSPAPTAVPATGAPATETPATASVPTLNLAFFAAASANGYSAATWQGIQDQVAKYAGAATIYDGKFDSSVQLKQVEDAAASGKFNGFIIVANDTVGIASAISAAWETNKIPTVTTLFPIGPNLTTLEAQIPGIVGTVAQPPADGAKMQADSVVAYCENIDPCRVVILIGQLQYPFDKVRYDAYNEVLAQHSNIKVVATGSGNYSRDTSLKAMQDILVANPEINAVLSNADQQTQGAVIALKDAGIDPKSVFITGAGATETAVAAVIAGEWTNDFANYPVSEGSAAVDVLQKFYEGNTTPVAIDASSFYPFSPLLTKEILDANPDFKGEWKG